MRKIIIIYIVIMQTTCIFAMEKPSPKRKGRPFENLELTAPKIKPQAIQIPIQHLTLAKLNLQQAKDFLFGTSTCPINYDTAFNLLEELASKKNIDTQARNEAYFLLGHIYYFGLGKPKNLNRAQEYYKHVYLVIKDEGLKNAAYYYLESSRMLQRISEIIKSTKSLDKTISLIKKILNPQMQQDENINEFILDTLQSTYPESNRVLNNIYLATPGAIAVARKLIETDQQYFADAVKQMKLSLFLNNQQFFNYLYTNFMPLKNLVDKGWLIVATQNHDYNNLVMFLKAGANINHTNPWGANPLKIAQQKNDMEMINWLLSHGAHSVDVAPPVAAPIIIQQPPAAALPQVMPENLNELLIAATKSGDYTDLGRLLAGGADINYRDAIGDNPLIIAIKKGDAALVTWLLEHGADPLFVVYQDERLTVTPEWVAKDEKQEAIVKIIEDYLLTKLKFINTPPKSSPIKPAAAVSPRKVIKMKPLE